MVKDNNWHKSGQNTFEIQLYYVLRRKTMSIIHEYFFNVFGKTALNSAFYENYAKYN